MILLTTNRSVGPCSDKKDTRWVRTSPFHLKELFDEVKGAMNREEDVLERGVNFHPSERGFHDHEASLMSRDA
jgi:hypothetical protein